LVLVAVTLPMLVWVLVKLAVPVVLMVPPVWLRVLPVTVKSPVPVVRVLLKMMVPSANSVRGLLLVVTVPVLRAIVPPALGVRMVVGSLKVEAWRSMAPLLLVRPMVMPLKPFVSAAKSLVVRVRLPATLAAVPIVIGRVAVNGCSRRVLLPLMLLALLKSISSVVKVTAPVLATIPLVLRNKIPGMAVLVCAPVREMAPVPVERTMALFSI